MYCISNRYLQVHIITEFLGFKKKKLRGDRIQKHVFTAFMVQFMSLLYLSNGTGWKHTAIK